MHLSYRLRTKQLVAEEDEGEFTRHMQHKEENLRISRFLVGQTVSLTPGGDSTINYRLRITLLGKSIQTRTHMVTQSLHLRL